MADEGYETPLGAAFSALWSVRGVFIDVGFRILSSLCAIRCGRIECHI